MKILIVDDDFQVRVAQQKWLERQGHEVCMASSGEAAIRLLDQELHFAPVDLVILDVNLGDGFDGVEVSRRIRNTPALKDTAVFIITGESPASIRQRARQESNALESVRLILQKGPDYLGDLDRAIELLQKTL